MTNQKINNGDDPVGYARLCRADLNKSTAFTHEEREKYGLTGLLPHGVSTQKEQQTRVLANFHRKYYDIERYILLRALQNRNERLFYSLVIDYIDEIMPIIYTPTVGQACQEFAHIFRQTRGLYVTHKDKGQIEALLENWPTSDVRLIVITDGERILGLGDLGANGMGISIGKLALYVACAGIHPSQCLPVMLDIGTNNETLRNDPLYLGTKQERLKGDGYLELVDEFVSAVQVKFPRALIQFEDFLTPNAYKLLHIYHKKVLCFNDDIQGTAAVALAGVLASNRITGNSLNELRILFLGAGSAATGIADLIQFALQHEGLSASEAAARLSLVDREGLIVQSRTDIEPHQEAFVDDLEQMDFMDALKTIKPHILIGATGAPGTFNQAVVELMSAINERPVIFALSNPTSKAECTAEQAYRWSKGKVIFASGSPFHEVSYESKTYQPGQGNNAYIFPGVGLGAIACEASLISDEMFLQAAQVLAENVDQSDLDRGSIYPPLKEIRTASHAIAVAVAEQAYKQGLATRDRPLDLEKTILDMMYDPYY